MEWFPKQASRVLDASREATERDFLALFHFEPGEIGIDFILEPGEIGVKKQLGFRDL
jgi:hypothetical protein